MTMISRLIAHMAWADQLALESLERATEPTPDTLELLAHVLGAEHTWISRLLGRPVEFAVWPTLSKGECARLLERNRRELTDYVTARAEHGLGEEVTYVNSAGRQFTSRADDILLQIFTHGPITAGRSRERFELREGNPTQPTTSPSSAALQRRLGRTRSSVDDRVGIRRTRSGTQDR